MPESPERSARARPRSRSLLFTDHGLVDAFDDGLQWTGQPKIPPGRGVPAHKKNKNRINLSSFFFSVPSALNALHERKNKIGCATSFFIFLSSHLDRPVQRYQGCWRRSLCGIFPQQSAVPSFWRKIKISVKKITMEWKNKLAIFSLKIIPNFKALLNSAKINKKLNSFLPFFIPL